MQPLFNGSFYMAKLRTLVVLLLGWTLLFSSSTFAGELDIGLYGGANIAGNSKITAKRNGATDKASVAWKGRSDEMPPFWGARATYWFDSAPGWGIALDFTHSKAYSDLNDAELVGKFTTLEFTDGINTLTANAMYRHSFENSNFSLYAGLGAGIIVPSVEITTTAAANIGVSAIKEYQLAGTTVQSLAGVSYKISDSWKVFAEGKFNYVMIDADINGGGKFKTSIPITQLIFGVSYSFAGLGRY